jgi:hypothetical protein
MYTKKELKIISDYQKYRKGGNLEKCGYEVEIVEQRAWKLGRLESEALYTHGHFELCFWTAKESCLPFDLVFDEAGKCRCNKTKAPRIKLYLEKRFFIPLSVEKKPKILLDRKRLQKAEKKLSKYPKEDLQKIYDFISQNQKAILKYWKGSIYNTQFFNLIKK